MDSINMLNKSMHNMSYTHVLMQVSEIYFTHNPNVRRSDAVLVNIHWYEMYRYGTDIIIYMEIILCSDV